MTWTIWSEAPNLKKSRNIIFNKIKCQMIKLKKNYTKESKNKYQLKEWGSNLKKKKTNERMDNFGSKG